MTSPLARASPRLVRHLNQFLAFPAQPEPVPPTPERMTMDRTMFALSLGLAAAILLPPHAVTLPRSPDHQPFNPFQTSSAPISSNDQVTIWKNSFSGSRLTTQTPKNTATAANGASFNATSSDSRLIWPRK